MTQTIMQKIRDWTIRRKILTGFAAVLLLTSIQGWFAISQLERLADTSGAALQVFGNTRSIILLTTIVTVSTCHRVRNRPRRSVRKATTSSPKSGASLCVIRK